MAGGDDLYSVLGVAKDASAADIKTAFRAIAKECHPDVAGEDAAKLERFKRARAAYEVLSDATERGRYDRRNERRPNSPFYGGHWGQAGKPVSPGGTGRMTEPANGLDLEDIFMDFSGSGGPDFGFGGKQRANVRPPAGGTPRPSAGRPPPASSPRPPPPHAHSGPSTPPRDVPPRAPPPPRQASAPHPSLPREPGRDIAMRVEVPALTALKGGVVTLNYFRVMRGDDGRTLHRYEEIHDLKIPPGTRHGETLRVEKGGDAGQSGGPYGDLICDILVVGAPPEPPPADPPVDPGPRMKMPPRPAPAGDVLRVDVGVVEALLGGRVPVTTAGGVVNVSIPPGTSSGTRFRLKGRGEGGSDLVAEVRIVVPKTLDEESRTLIEQFAKLNPTGD